MDTDAAPGDPELLRLLDEYGEHRYAAGMKARVTNEKDVWVIANYLRMADEDRAVLLDHITQHYVRRDRINGVFSVEGPTDARQP